MPLNRGQLQLSHSTTVPNLFLVGAPKCGTTSLYHYLNQHPDVFMSVPKEPHFFSEVSPDPAWHSPWYQQAVKDEQRYLALFANSQSRVVGEASASYLWSPGAAARIKRFNPDAKIVMMLRHPVERAFSHYLANVRSGIESRTFSEAIEAPVDPDGTPHAYFHLYVELGLYCEQVRRFLELFEDVLVLFYEEFFAQPESSLVRVFRFLGIQPAYSRHIRPDAFDSYRTPRNSVVKKLRSIPRMRLVIRSILPDRVREAVKGILVPVRPKPEVPVSVRKSLTHIYAPEYRCLEELLGRRVPWEL